MMRRCGGGELSLSCPRRQRMARGAASSSPEMPRTSSRRSSARACARACATSPISSGSSRGCCADESGEALLDTLPGRAQCPCPRADDAHQGDRSRHLRARSGRGRRARCPHPRRRRRRAAHHHPSGDRAAAQLWPARRGAACRQRHAVSAAVGADAGGRQLLDTACGAGWRLVLRGDTALGAVTCARGRRYGDGLARDRHRGGGSRCRRRTCCGRRAAW